VPCMCRHDLPSPPSIHQTAEVLPSCSVDNPACVLLRGHVQTDAQQNEPARYARRVPAECPESVRDLIAACMDADPAERPSAREIVEVLTSGDGKGLKQQRHPPRKRSTPEVRPRCSQSACQLRRARQSFAGPLLMVHAPGLALFWCVLVRKPIRFCVEFV